MHKVLLTSAASSIADVVSRKKRRQFFSLRKLRPGKGNWSFEVLCGFRVLKYCVSFQKKQPRSRNGKNTSYRMDSTSICEKTNEEFLQATPNFGIVGIAPIKTGFVGYSTSRCAQKQEDESKIVNTDIANICNMDNTPTATLSATIKLDTTAIDEQKKRAKKFWNDSSYNEDLKERINDDVMNHLDLGLLLPIFHTLCRPPDKRLFLPDTRVGKEDENCSDVIQLSAAPVTMGVCGEEDDIAGKVSQRDERSYIPAFFKNKNVGNYEVEDSNSRWIFDVHYTSIVTTLVNTPSQMVGEDIEVTKLLDPFCFDRFNGNNLITRRLSRGVVADCFERSKAGSTYAIVGSLGIGKSWTLIYTLQQALLHENACVLFCFQGNSDAIVCIRRNNCIYVWSSAYGPWSHVCYSSLFDNSNVLVLLVPVFSL